MNMEHTIAQQVARPVALREHELMSAVKPDRTRDQELFPRDGDQKEKCGKEEGLQERLHHQGRYFVSRCRSTIRSSCDRDLLDEPFMHVIPVAQFSRPFPDFRRSRSARDQRNPRSRVSRSAEKSSAALTPLAADHTRAAATAARFATSERHSVLLTELDVRSLGIVIYGAFAKERSQLFSIVYRFNMTVSMSIIFLRQLL